MVKNLQFVCHGDGRLTLHRSRAPLVNKQFRTTLNGILVFTLHLCQFCIVFTTIYFVSISYSFPLYLSYVSNVHLCSFEFQQISCPKSIQRHRTLLDYVSNVFL
jgi:hypothetical protein